MSGDPGFQDPGRRACQQLGFQGEDLAQMYQGRIIITPTEHGPQNGDKIGIERLEDIEKFLARIINSRNSIGFLKVAGDQKLDRIVNLLDWRIDIIGVYRITQAQNPGIAFHDPYTGRFIAVLKGRAVDDEPLARCNL